MEARRRRDVGQSLYHPCPYLVSERGTSSSPSLHGRGRAASRIGDTMPDTSSIARAQDDSGARLPVFQRFIDALRALWSRESDNERRMTLAKPLFERLVMDPELKARSASWPSTEGRKNLLFYVD